MKLALPICCALVSLPALAQGFQLSPAVTLGVVYDDDLSPQGSSPAAAVFTELAPRITLGYSTSRLAIVARGDVDAELLDEAPVENTPYVTWNASVQLLAQLTDRLTLSGDGALYDTDTPRALDVTTGYDPGLVRLESGTADAALDWRLSARLHGQLKGSFASNSELGLSTNEESLQATLLDQLTGRDGGRLDLLGRHFDFGGRGSINVAAAMAGWDRLLTPKLSLSLLAGPRFDTAASQGRVRLDGLEGLGQLAWAGERVHLSLGLASTQIAVPGFLGLVDTGSASLLAIWRPDDRWRLTAAPAGYLSSGDPLHARVFELRVDAVRAVNDWIFLVASYRFTAQHATYGPSAIAAAAGLESSMHNQVVLGVSFGAKAQAGLPVDFPTVSAWTTPAAPALVSPAPDSSESEKP